METTENSKIKVKKVTQSELLLSGWKGGRGYRGARCRLHEVQAPSGNVGAARAPAQSSLKVARLSPRLPGPGIRVHAAQRDAVASGHLPGYPQHCRCHRGAVGPWPLPSLRPGARSTSDLPAGGAGAAGAVPGPVSLLRVVLGPAPAARGSRSRGCGVRRGRVHGRSGTLRGSFGACHGPGARGGGGRVGPGAAGGGAAGDWAGAGDRIAGAAARPFAMAPRGRASRLPLALPSPPDARRALPARPRPRPARPAATCATDAPRSPPGEALGPLKRWPTRHPGACVQTRARGLLGTPVPALRSWGTGSGVKHGVRNPGGGLGPCE